LLGLTFHNETESIVRIATASPYLFVKKEFAALGSAAVDLPTHPPTGTRESPASVATPTSELAAGAGSNGALLCRLRPTNDIPE
jgi:hypothetical protein